MGSSMPPVWTLDPYDYIIDSKLRPIHIYMGETIVGRFVTPGLKDIGYFSKQHMIFRLTEAEDGKVEGTVEYLGSCDRTGLIGNSVVGDTVMVKDGTKHPIKVGMEIHLLRTNSDRGGKGLKYMYTVQEGYGKLSDYYARHALDDVEMVGIGKRKREDMGPDVPKMPECVDISELPSDDENDNKSGKGKEGERGEKDETWDHLAGEFTCQICFDLMVESTNVDCGHIFCSACLEDWVRNSEACPSCRKKITMMAPCLVLDASIEKMVETGKVPDDDAEEYKNRRKLAKDARKGALRESRHLAPVALPAPPQSTVQQADYDSQQLALEESLAEQARQARELERMKAELERHKTQAARRSRRLAS